MAPLNFGILKEDEIVDSLNDKLVKDLSNNMKNLLKNLYGVIDESKTVKCFKVDDSFKTDFVICYDDKIRNVSMKSGRAEIVHNEILSNFIDYLLDCGISKRTCETIQLFHYGDHTIDGTGKERLSYPEVMHELNDRIKEANYELNRDRDFVLDFVRRMVFKGANKDNIEADSIYFGDKDYGIVATKKQIMKHVKKRSFDYYDNLHVGPLLLRPDARYANKDVSDERKRNRIVVYWPNLAADIEYIAKRYDYEYVN